MVAGVKETWVWGREELEVRESRMEGSLVGQARVQISVMELGNSWQT